MLSADGDPLRLVYRDLADIRVSPARLARHGIPAPQLTGRIVTDDEPTLRRKLFGSLVAGALGATAGSRRRCARRWRRPYEGCRARPICSRCSNSPCPPRR